ncbi:MAG: hypothetical protein B6U86_01135 [Candidatus Altiarchaeales archaeon ex4484_43]|nr:MAG: hypothetical protein B6U86_01135 [Candidatus Altiarchaeales archaeon ex4484_43]
MEELSRFERDALTEIINIGAGHASNALSVMTGKRIKINFPELKLCSVEDIPGLVGKPEEVVATVYLRMDGELGDRELVVGSMLLLLPQESAVELSALLQQEKISKKGVDELDEMDISALQETGNILSGASLTAISKILNVKLIESPPHFACDMLQAVLSGTVAELARKVNRALLFKTMFEIEEYKIRAYYILLFDPETLNMILNRIKESFSDIMRECAEEDPYKGKLSRFERDALTEIINIGAGHASNALSVMTGKRIRVIERIPKLIGKPEELVVSVYLKIEGIIKNRAIPVGSLIFLFPHRSAVELSALLENKPIEEDDLRELSEMDISALEETGNILSGASLTAISKVLDIKLVESLPHFAHDMLQAVLSFALIELAPKTTEALTFTTDFEVEDHNIKAYFLLLLDPESLEMLREKMKILFEHMLKEYIEEEYMEEGCTHA